MAETSKSKKAAESKTVSKKPIIYLGPNLPQDGLKYGMVLSDYPTHLNELYEQIPAIKKLFFDVTKTAKVKLDLKSQGTESYRLYAEVKKRYADIKNMKGGNS